MNWKKAVFHVSILDMCMATKRISIDFTVLKGYVKSFVSRLFFTAEVKTAEPVSNAQNIFIHSTQIT